MENVTYADAHRGELHFTECNNVIYVDCPSEEVDIKIGGIWLVFTTKQAEILRDKLIEKLPAEPAGR